MKLFRYFILFIIISFTGVHCDGATFATIESGDEVLDINEDIQYLHYLADASESNIYSLSVDTSGSYLFELVSVSPATVNVYIDFGNDSSNASCAEADGNLSFPCTVSLDDTANQAFTVTAAEEVRYTLLVHIPVSSE